MITHWSTSTAGSYPSVLQGGMTYSNGYITVPESGIYFIYFNLYSALFSFPGYRKPGIFVDSLLIGISQYYHEVNRGKSRYLGMLWNVRKGSKLSVRTEGGSMDYYFGSDHSCFGAWKIN